nr:hypothetical protein [Phycisphaerales bacterium]
DPISGRWLQRDPAGFVDGNSLYEYVAGGPLGRIDPMGLMAWYDVAIDHAANFGAGFGDVVTAGFTNYVREKMGTNDAVDKDSTAYKAGEVTGAVTVGVVGGIVAAPAAAAIGLTGAGAAMFVGGAAGFYADAAQQGNDIQNGEQRGYDWQRGAVATGTGAVLGGLFHHAGNLLNRVFGGPSGAVGGGAAGGAAEGEGVAWNNGWRTADGRFASPQGAGRPGAAAENAVWDAVEGKPGWQVIRGRVSARDASGQLRVYDGAARPPGSADWIGLEVKSGSARLTAEQRAFDSALNASGPQTVTGCGQNAGLPIRRAIEIRRP